MEVSAKATGARIAEKREAMGISQEAFAKEIGISRPKISLVEIGERTLTSVELAQAAKILNVSSDYLLGLSDLETPDISIQSVCSYTGLPEAAIKQLQQYGKSSLQFLPRDSIESGSAKGEAITAGESLAKLLEVRSFYRFLLSIGQTGRLVSQCEEALKTSKDLLWLQDRLDYSLYSVERQAERLLQEIYGTEDLMKRLDEAVMQSHSQER